MAGFTIVVDPKPAREDIQILDEGLSGHAIAQAGDASSVGRPHIAKAAGTQPDQMGAFFDEYLIPGAKAFVSRRWPTAAEAIDLIRGAGGAPVLAHPFWDLEEPKAVAALIDDLSIDGVEVFYPAHDREQTKDRDQNSSRHAMLRGTLILADRR